MGGKTIPESKGGVVRETCYTCCEMVLVRLNALLCCVGTMHVRWYVLILGLLSGDELLYVGRGFVVQFVELWFESSSFEIGVDFLIRSE